MNRGSLPIPSRRGPTPLASPCRSGRGRGRSGWYGLAVGVLLLAGCTQGKPAEPLLQSRLDAKRWPPPPAKPRIRFLGAIASEKDLQAPVNLWHRIVGQQRPRKLVSPTAVAVAGDDILFVIDKDDAAVHRFDLAARRHELIGADHLQVPSALSWAEGRLYVADAAAGAIFTWSPATGLRRFDRDAPQRPAGLVYVPAVQRLFVSDLAAPAIHAYAADGRRAATFDLTDAGVGSPTHLAYHPDAGLLVSDALGGRVVRLDLDGNMLATLGAPGDAPGNLALPKGVATDSQGHVYVVDARFESVQVFDAQGRILMAFGQEGTGEGEFWLPAGLCIDDNDRIWVADTYNCRVQVFEYLGAVSDDQQVSAQR